MRIFYDTDANMDILRGKKIAIIGYGSQGHAQAQNLRDSGLQVVVGARSGGPGYEKAVEDGFSPVSAREAAEQADVIQLLTPDHGQAALYRNDVAPSMGAGKTLLFSHGFNIHYGQILPPAEADVVMVAP
ncbi:MAG: NAD(P)-dependent oxidoreductase, partial [Deltaproteobacteria bacterium]|nr:NAD(P)-dependent oxidoreductase [Deltaproteobacteria bacterium]